MPELTFASIGIEDLTVPHQVKVNPWTGAAMISVPLPTTPGRSDFGPVLSLNYSSSAGNSVFGVGWSLGGLPSIGRTPKKLPLYNSKDKFVLNGSNELVPSHVEEEDDFCVHYFRSQIEHNYIRFEQWIHKDTGRVHWRSWDGDNTLTIYGRTDNGLIADPKNPDRIYLWLAEAQIDRYGNAIVYEFVSEDIAGIDFGEAFEQHRKKQTDYLPQRYLKRVHYGNTRPPQLDPLLPDDNRWPFEDDNEWLFELVFDYGDHGVDPLPTPNQTWPAREDPHSDYRPGFEVRTYRLCQRILMFHSLAVLGPNPQLVWAMTLGYKHNAAGTTLKSIEYAGFRGSQESGRALPPLTFKYSESEISDTFHSAPEQSLVNLPNGLSDTRYRWVDLFGEGLPGILSETDQAWYYKPNCGEGRFGPQKLVATKPSQRLGNYSLTDFDRDGNLNVVVLTGRQAGYYELDRDTSQWQNFKPFPAAPQLDTAHTRAQWLDLNGDGLSDIIICKADRFTWYPSLGKEGFDAPIDLAKPHTNGTSHLPAISERLDLDLMFADMTGDGLIDQVCIQNGRVEYWPQLGNGQFGEGVLMENAPIFDSQAEFDPARLRLVDLNGSGTADILYIGQGRVCYWYNASGNQFVEEGELRGLPYIDKLAHVQVLDFLGNGTLCLVWSSPLLCHASNPLRFLLLTKRPDSNEGVRPRLLESIDNNMGQKVEITYGSSGAHYLRDLNTGRGWLSHLPSHVVVVDQITVIDEIADSRFTKIYAYHDGFFDSHKREFLGFGLVEEFDTELFANLSGGVEEEYTAPACVRTWYHTGAVDWDHRAAIDFYTGDPKQQRLPAPIFEETSSLAPDDYETGFRALAGLPIRREEYAVEADGQCARHPYQVTQTAYRLRRVQPATDDYDACFAVYQSESLDQIYEQQPDDPRLNHQVTLAVDTYGNVERTCTVAYPRRSTIADRKEDQRHVIITASVNQFTNFDQPDRYEIGIPVESQQFELGGLEPVTDTIFDYESLLESLGNALVDPLAPHEPFDVSSTNAQARFFAWDRFYYWNDDRSAPLPLRGIGIPTLIHHIETACFTSQLIADGLGRRISSDDQLATEGYYQQSDDYWWQSGSVQHYLADDGFYLLHREENLDGSQTEFTYDDDCVVLQATEDALGNLTRAEIDYYVLAPWRITDPNDNVAEVCYDSLGMIVVSTEYGTIVGLDGPESEPLLYGNEPLTGYSIQPSADLDAILADPERFLQGASQYLAYDLETPPLKSATLVREQFVHTRDGNTLDSHNQIIVTYSDGFGRTLQVKQKVEPGLAIAEDPTGSVRVDEDGRPEMEFTDERWLVSGHTVYNNKQQAVRQYEPFFSPTVEFEADEILCTFGVSSLSHYDALGRLVRTDLPDGTLIREEITAWAIQRYDANDTVLESKYRTQLEAAGLTANDPRMQALRKAEAHADTPTVIHLDPLGREIVQVEQGGADDERVTRYIFDIQGNVTSIIDPRGLVAFTYQYDMLGRILHECSIDSGDRWTFTDALDRVLHQWDGREIHQHFTYDLLGRPLSVHVDGVLGLNQITERLTYGEDLPENEAKRRNARGQLVTHRDQAGVLSVSCFDPTGNPLRSECHLRSDYAAEVNWDDPENVPLEPEGPYVSETDYDALGRVTRQQLPDGTTRTFRYLPGGGVQRVGVTTADGELDDTPYLVEAEFNARGQRTRALLGNGVEIRYTYDDETFRLQNLRSLIPPDAGDNPVRIFQNIYYTYDPVGNITHMVDEAQQPGVVLPVVHGLNVSSHSDFTYDAFYQLTAASGRLHEALAQHDYRFGYKDRDNPSRLKGTRHISLNNGEAVERYTRLYQYDLAGNIEQIKHEADSRSWTNEIWTSATSNRSLPKHNINGTSITDPESYFDANGNCICQPHLRTITWNYRNNIERVVAVDRSDEGRPDDVEYYVYGGDGMRVRKVTQRLVNGEQEIVEVTDKRYLDGCEIKRMYHDSEPKLERITSHITDGDNRIALLHQWTADRLGRETDNIGEKKAHYQLTNHLGSVCLELSGSARVISYEEYFPFGGTAFICGDDVKEVKIKDVRYSGKERDDLTGFYYYGYRYYAPWLGNWLSPDPIGPEDSPNLYQFVGNNPIGARDYAGLCGDDETWHQSTNLNNPETRQLMLEQQEQQFERARQELEEARHLTELLETQAECRRHGASCRITEQYDIELGTTRTFIEWEEEPPVEPTRPVETHRERPAQVASEVVEPEAPEATPSVESTREVAQAATEEPQQETHEITVQPPKSDPFVLLKKPDAYEAKPPPATMLGRPRQMPVLPSVVIGPQESISPTEQVMVERRAAVALERARSYALQELQPTDWTDFEVTHARHYENVYTPVFEPGEVTLIGWHRSSTGYQEITNREGKVVWVDELTLARPPLDPIDLVPVDTIASAALRLTGRIGSGLLAGGARQTSSRLGRRVVTRRRAIQFDYRFRGQSAYERLSERRAWRRPSEPSPEYWTLRRHNDPRARPRRSSRRGIRLESHHPLQKEWARQRLPHQWHCPPYDDRVAPTILIEGRQRGLSTIHTRLTTPQNVRAGRRVGQGLERFGTTLEEELFFMVNDLRAAGYSDLDIRLILRTQYRMLDKLGVVYSHSRPAGF